MKYAKATALVLAFFLCALTACLVLFFRSSGCGTDRGLVSGERTIMSNGIERVYYLKLPEPYDSRTPYPLLFGFHGAGGDYRAFTEGSYDLPRVVGEDAILVYPLGLANEAGLTLWDQENDLIFFDDLYRELEENLCFDTGMVFAVGHSAGAGFTHVLGCRRGNLLRAIAPVSGALLDHDHCVGQVAVLQIQGANDQLVPLGLIRPTRDYWIAINGCSKEQTGAGTDPVCTAYGGCDVQFPVEYCEHVGGHEWPDFAGEAIWSFFKNLPPAPPSDKPGTGDVDNLGRGTISFSVGYPADFVGTPAKMVLALYPYNTVPPLSTAPSFILALDVPLRDYRFGEVTEYADVEISLLGLDYGDYTLSVVVYVEGSSYPIPTEGKDYMGLQNVTINSNTLVIGTPFELAPAQMSF